MAVNRPVSQLAVLGGVLVAAFVGLRLTGTPLPTWSFVVGGLGVAMLLAFLWVDRGSGAEEHQKVTQAHGSALFLVGASATACVLLNAWVGSAGIRFDASFSGSHTLAPHSVSAARALTEPIELVGLFPAGSVEEQQFVDLVARFEEETDKLSLRLVDPLESPMEFDALREWVELETLGTLQVLFLIRGESEETHRVVVVDGPLLEEDMVLALTRVQQTEPALICFTNGHQERDLGERYNLVGYGGIHERLLGANFEVGLVGPLQRVPERCKTLVVAAPESSLHPVTQEQIAAYVRSGGALVVLLEPVRPGQGNSVPLDLERYGFEIGDDLVLETHPDRVLADVDASHVVVDMNSFDFHPIVNGLDRATIFQGARSVGAGPAVSGIQVQPLAFSTELGWAETDPLSLSGQEQATQGAHEASRVPLMAIAEVVDPGAVVVGETRLEGESSDFGVRVLGEGEKPPGVPEHSEGRLSRGRIVVFGDADFLSNRLVLGGVNHDLFLNTLSWLVDEEAPRGERAHSVRSELMVLSEKQSQQMWRLLIGGIPGLAVAMACLVWWRRRRG